MSAAADRRAAREAQAESEVSAGTDARDAREAQERSEVSADADARDARETQAQSEVMAAAERRGVREAWAESEVSAGTDARDAREAKAQSEVMAAAERRGVREAQAESEVSAGTDARDAREAQERSEVSAGADARDAREAQAQSEVSAGADARDARETQERREVVAGADARDAREAQERSEVTAGADARDARETQERREVMAGAERRGAREAQAESEVSAGSGAREAREAQERSEVAAAAERSTAREVQERSEVSAAADRRAAREAQERSEVGAHAERRVTRETRERKDQALVQAQRLESLGQLAGGVAHDFNNLLAVILNYLSFASEDVAAAAGSDPAPHLASVGADLAEVKKAAQRAAGLTHQLLLFARRDVVRPQVLDFDRVITSVEEMLRRTLGEHVELVVTRGDDLWPVLADPGQLEQVLVNLAVNARDAMPDGGTLTIDTSNITVDADMIAGGSKARPGRNVRLRVSDTGVGMTTETAEHVFEPFFTTKKDGGGTGLGLATVYGILMQADGDIRIYSEPGAGTTFIITLPVTAEAATPLSEPAPYQRTPNGRNRPGRRGRGGTARGDQADLDPQRLPGDHRRQRP